MDLALRESAPAERLYACGQSTQIAGQCGSPGYLYGSLDNTGTVFTSTWERNMPSLNTPEFKAEFNTVLDRLRFDERYGNALKNRAAMIAFRLDHPQARLEDCGEYVFRADTQDCSCLIRCAPGAENRHVYIHPYRREWLDRHMRQAERGIRFITPDYKEKFRVPDGETVRITWSDGTKHERVARYVDDCHLELCGDYTNLYHICELAERLERAGSAVIPLRSSLPEKCYSVAPDSDKIIIVTRGETGFEAAGVNAEGMTCCEGADKLNEVMGITKAQEAAMLAGSMFGWDTPAADPKSYDERGQLKRANRSRDYER